MRNQGTRGLSWDGHAPSRTSSHGGRRQGWTQRQQQSLTSGGLSTPKSQNRCGIKHKAERQSRAASSATTPETERPTGAWEEGRCQKPRRDADPQAGPRMPPPGSFVCVPSGGRRHLRVSTGEQDEGVAARGRPDAPQGPMLPLPEVPVMRDHRGDEQRCSAVVPARCLANRPNGHSGAGGAGSVDAGRALCLAGAAVNSGASGGGRRSEGESFTEPGRGRGGGRGGPRTCHRLQQTPPPAAGRTQPSRRGPSCASPASVPGLPRIYLASAFPHQMHENTQEQLVPCPGWALGAHTGLPPAEAFPRRLSPGPPRRGGRGRNQGRFPSTDAGRGVCGFPKGGHAASARLRPARSCPRRRFR